MSGHEHTKTAVWVLFAGSGYLVCRVNIPAAITLHLQVELEDSILTLDVE